MQICKSVTLRTRKCKNGMMSFYLDYYPCYRDKETRKILRHESLGIYIYEKPKNHVQQEHNNIMMEKAETIRCRKYESVVNERFDLFDKAHLKEDFLAYFKKQTLKHNMKWDYAYKHFYDYVDGKCTFGEIDVELCQGFGEYLSEEAFNKNTGNKLAKNTSAGYWNVFRHMLGIAFRNKQISENINSFLTPLETERKIKDSLTLEELYRLYNTDCSDEVLKRAAIFSCMTGLRFSDVKAMTWDKVSEYADGGKYLDFECVKTGKRCIVPINDDVLMIMGRKSTGVVFKGLEYVMTQTTMKKWLAAAKITKHITFHSFRHTYATLQVELGTDIYTVQSLLGHANVSTTEIYARHADAKNREAANKISLKVLKSVSKRSSNKRKKSSEEEDNN